jgi:uncharacterized membrane protein
MSRVLRTATWVFFAVTMYLILTEAVRPWLRLPELGNVGFTLVFVLFAIFHCAAQEGGRRAAAFFAISAVVSYVMEEMGVRTGMVFGPYHYSDMLGAKLGHVPILIPLAWFMMIYPSWCVGRELMRGLEMRRWAVWMSLAVVAALVMTGWDMVMDPGMSAEGNWVWEKSGGYFGVPRRNYLGWVATTFLVYLIAGWVLPRLKEMRLRQVGRSFEALPVIVYAFFAVRYIVSGWLPALEVIALFAMGLPGLLALLRVYLPASGGEGAAAI